MAESAWVGSVQASEALEPLRFAPTAFAITATAETLALTAALLVKLRRLIAAQPGDSG